MDNKRFVNAGRLRDEGKLSEAYNEFIQIAENATDPLDKAGALLRAANTLEISGHIEAAASKLSVARSLMENYLTPESQRDEKVSSLELFLNYEEANLSWLRGDNLETALSKFETLIKKHKLGAALNNRSTAPKDLFLRDFYESTQIRRAFILTDLGRWKEALPILEAMPSPKEYRGSFAFYMGYCYLADHDYIGAEQKLSEALILGGLPRSLECRAHCELGTTYYSLRDYRKAKKHFEKGAQLADAAYIKDGQLWKWLEMTCRALGMKAEADHYAQMARTS